MDKTAWKVGELAKLTGITVRTLHHYDQVGLLVPSSHSDTGQRRYSKKDIDRLQQIISLKRLGFRLDECKELLDNPNYRADEAIRLQLERLGEEIRIQRDLRGRLQELHDLLRTRQEVTAEQLIKTIEVMQMTEKYFTPESMAKLKRQRELLGVEKIKEVENEWPSLIAKVRAELNNNTSPESREVQVLAKRWKELTRMFTGGDATIAKSVERYYAENPQCGAELGIDHELWQYISKAMAVS